MITKNTESGRAYGVVPAKLLEKLNFWKEVILDEKIGMMLGWVKHFVEESEEDITFPYLSDKKKTQVIHNVHNERLVFGLDENSKVYDKLTTYFDLKKKTYTKRLTELERNFYRYIYNHKARFIPTACD